MKNNKLDPFSENDPPLSSSTNAFIRAELQKGNLESAEQLLKQPSLRDAEWNFLMGLLFLKKGWQDDAYTSLNTACNMAPSNVEYKEALSSLNNRNTAYKRKYSNRFANDGGLCECFFKFQCLDLCCDCLGDLICDGS